MSQGFGFASLAVAAMGCGIGAVARFEISRRIVERVEVQVRKEDADLVRELASALGDPEPDAETRVILREQIARRRGGLEALLVSAPLEDIELDRPRDFGRDFVP